MSEYVKFAADVAKKVISAGCGEIKGSGKPGLVRRAIDFPSLMLTLGFQPAFTFYASKIDNYGNVYRVYKYLKGDLNDGSAICGELERSEGSGYAGYVAVLLLLLEKVGKDVKLTSERPEEVFKVLLDLTTSVDFSTERLLLPYLEEVKKIMEALPYG